MATQAFNALTGVSVGSNANIVIDANANAVFANVSGNFANFDGNVSANYFIGNGANINGNVSANFYFGDGGYLTNVSAVGSSLLVSQYTTGTLSNTIANVSNLLFDTTTGFNVTDLGSNTALISLGSTFKTWEVDGQANLVAVGEDVVKFVAGSGIDIKTNASAYPQQIIFSANLGNISDNEISNGTTNVSIPTANGNVFISVNGNANVAVITGTGANINGTLTVSNTVTISNTAGGATNIALGSPTQGNLVSNAITFTTDSTVSNAIAQLNTVLGKLVPNSPTNFPTGQSIAIQGLSTYRMANYTQTDNTPGANKSVAGGTTVSTVTRVATYTTSNIANAGPGDSGTITAYLNGANAGARTLTANLDGNGTYSNLIIFNNVDYHTVNANIAPGFWSVFSSRASGTVTQGWNEVYIADSTTSNTNTSAWFYDSSSPGTPTFSSLSITAPGSPSYAYSSTVPHYDNTNNFNIGFNCTKLSGNMYPVSDNFVTGTAGGAFAAPASVSYATAGVTTPLVQNLYVSSGSQAVTTASSIISGFGASTTGPSVNVLNSYATGTQSFTTTLGANVLYKTGTVSSSSVIQEANVYIGSTIGVGSGLAFRIINPGASNTPYYTGYESAFDSQSGTLRIYDATVVANILKHDQTNYSTGYLPAGPNLSSGRTGTQYFTFKVVRTSVSKFDVGWSGNIAGLWVALPGSVIDSTSTANGWLDMSVSYAGAGVPGANVAAGGNGSNGSALGGPAPINTIQTNKFITATFGTVSSSSTAMNEIYIRIGLTSGQSVTALSLQAASH
jgi:hypothetical protein